MTEAVLDIGLLGTADWRLLRATRLRALLDSPRAFHAQYRTELAWDERQWRQRLEAFTWVVAREVAVSGRAEVVGVAALADEAQEPAARHLESVWVAPAHRRRGVLRTLLDALAAVARQNGVTTLLLWVMEDNRAALLAYARLGFEPTHESQPIGIGRREVRLRRAV